MIRESFNSLNISNKLAAVFLLLLFMMGAGGSVGLYNGTQIDKVTDKLYIDAFKRTQTLSGIEKDLLGQRQVLFLLSILTETDSKSYIEGSLQKYKDDIVRQISEYRSYGAKGQDHLLHELDYALSDYWKVQDEAVLLSVSGKRARAIALIRGDGDIRFVTAMNSLKNLINNETNRAYSAYNTIKSFAGIIIIATLSLTVAAIFLGAGLWYVLTRSIVTPIRTIEESARKLSRGELKARIPVLTKDELGSLAGVFNEMAANIEDIYATLENKVSDRTEELGLANTELLGKKQELETANLELMSANKMKSQFLANVSHEFRTPLNSIIGFSDLMKEGSCGKLTEKQSQYLEYIRTSGVHLLNLINNILDLSRIAAGNVSLEPEDFTVVDVLGEVLGTVRPEALERDITIESKRVPASPVIRADRSKFKQILINLVTNAIKFNHDSGHVWIDWDIKEEPKGMVMERYLVLSVRDTGIGIKEEDFERLFKEFEQIDTSQGREYEGSGLGLALASRLVDLHGGSIWVESAPGEGATFFIKLPQGTERVEMPEQSRLRHLSRSEGDNRTVIVACESPDLNQLLSIYLSGGGYEPVTATDGVELMTKARDTVPFAIIMGITLPNMDGWEVLKELAAAPKLSAIPVLILSSIDDKDTPMTLGAYACLEKPISKDGLIDMLSRIGGKGGSFKGDGTL